MSSVIEVPNYSSICIAVYGDVMLDRYYYGNVSRISPEAPVPVVSVEQIDARPGGAANVALNVAVLGSAVTLIGAVGQDSEAEILKSLLAQKNIHCRLLSIHNYSTITKLRILAQHQQLLRADFEKFLDYSHAQMLFQQFQDILPTVDAIILSDYAKGSITADASIFIQKARAQGLPVFVDPKCSDFSRYAGATIITPNRHELQAVIGHCDNDNDMIEKSRRLIDMHQLEAILITQGADGMVLVEKDKEAVHFKALNREVYDVTGAGDTVISVLAASITAGCTIPQATRLANIAAGIAVGKLGATSITPIELRTEIESLNKKTSAILAKDALLAKVTEARMKGEKIVMTNGCFDILHLGHLEYLIAAKALGDRLIVAVNDDASLARLKGQGRPLNHLSARMALLSALDVVDWVVSFSEDTPYALIGEILPDILVKGSDYDVQEIVGADIVRQHGGCVLTIPLAAEYSTTRLIQKIKQATT